MKKILQLIHQAFRNDVAVGYLILRAASSKSYYVKNIYKVDKDLVCIIDDENKTILINLNVIESIDISYIDNSLKEKLIKSISDLAPFI